MSSPQIIKKYLVDSYLKDKNNNGNILMLSGAWGSGKTHFWKNTVEPKIVILSKDDNKSYIYISLYGKDSLEDIQNEILLKSYNFLQTEDRDLLSSTYSVFTKITSFSSKVSIFGIGLDLKGIGDEFNEMNYNKKLKQGISFLNNGGIVCFDDFERKSSKINLNDLFGFITNLAENFKAKIIIIVNQEHLNKNDKTVFNNVKEKSINKFLLFDPTIDELFDEVYLNEFNPLDEYREEILKTIKLTEEKNARIYIQVLKNCLEYVKNIKPVNEKQIFLITLVTIIFVKYNLIIKMKMYGNTYLPDLLDRMPQNIAYGIINIFPIVETQRLANQKESILDALKDYISQPDESKNYASSPATAIARVGPTKKSVPKVDEKLKEDFGYINNHSDIIWVIYKYAIYNKCFIPEDSEALEVINNFIASGILLQENYNNESESESTR